MSTIRLDDPFTEFLIKEHSGTNKGKLPGFTVENNDFSKETSKEISEIPEIIDTPDIKTTFTNAWINKLSTQPGMEAVKLAKAAPPKLKGPPKKKRSGRYKSMRK
jgi:hypothetical protein